MSTQTCLHHAKRWPTLVCSKRCVTLLTKYLEYIMNQTITLNSFKPHEAVASHVVTMHISPSTNVHTSITSVQIGSIGHYCYIREYSCSPYKGILRKPSYP